MGQTCRLTCFQGRRNALRGQHCDFLHLGHFLVQPGLVEIVVSAQRFALVRRIKMSSQANTPSANACNLLHIAGLSFAKHHVQDSLDSEMQRRRFWACYLMHCALMENPASFEPIASISDLPLPSADPDFDAGAAHSLPATLENGRSGSCIYAELIRGFKHW